jgi:hypothetical protein
LHFLPRGDETCRDSDHRYSTGTDVLCPGLPLEREEYASNRNTFFGFIASDCWKAFLLQEILQTIHEELLATTRLPMAIDFLRAEILHHGRIRRARWLELAHYFAPFQAFVIHSCQ